MMNNNFIMVGKTSFLKNWENCLLRCCPNDKTTFIFPKKVFQSSDFEIVSGLINKASNNKPCEIEVFDCKSEFYKLYKKEFYDEKIICIKYTNYLLYKSKYILFVND